MDLSDSFLNNSDPSGSLPECNENVPVVVELQPDNKTLTLSVGKEQLISAQKTDAPLSSCFSLVTGPKV